MVHNRKLREGSMNPSTGYTGSATPADAQGPFNPMQALVAQMLSGVNTATLVQIVACTNSGGLSPVGFVDVQPLVNQVDGARNAVPHGELFSLPYLRIQGGSNAIIMDPQPGDIGIAVFASRDLSAVIAAKGQNVPGSARKFDMADGLYLGGVLNGAPTQYVQFAVGGITVTSPSAVTINAPQVTLNGAVQVNGAVTVTGDVTAAGKSLQTHVHSGVQSGGSNTGGPV